jgi:hypothetical protein
MENKSLLSRPNVNKKQKSTTIQLAAQSSKLGRLIYLFIILLLKKVRFMELRDTYIGIPKTFMIVFIYPRNTVKTIA